MVKIHIIGNVVADAKISVVNGKQVIAFSVAHNEKFKNPQGVLTEKGYFFNCNYWSDSAAIAQYIKKGTQIYVEGSQVTANGYSTTQGQINASVNVRVQSIQLLNSSSQQPTQTTAQPQQAAVEQQPQSKFNNDVASIYAGESEPLEQLPF